MTHLKCDPIPAFSDNYIWALHDAVHCAIVDPGDAAPVFAWIAQTQCIPVAILITHHHADHVAGISQLRRRYGEIPVYGPANEIIPELTHPLTEGDQCTLDALSLTLKVWHIPGHTLGHLGYIAENFALLGDTLFAGGCGRIFEGTAEQMYSSLSRIATLPSATKVYCAHEYTLSNLRFALAVEPNNEALIERAFAAQALREAGQPTVPSTIELELASNPFLRAHVPRVWKQAEQYAGLPLSNACASFAALRQWKNNFQEVEKNL